MYHHSYREMGEFAADNASKRLALISKVLKEYLVAGKTKEDFAEEYGCDIIFDEHLDGIIDIKFHNDSNETMFMLKYNNAR